MPIYEYQCKACSHKLETLQKISDPLLTDCPECGESQLRKCVSAPQFRLKGSGWYETDFKKDGKRNLADTGSKEKKDGADKKDATAKDKAASGNGKTTSPEKKTEKKTEKKAADKPASSGGKTGSTGASDASR